MRHYPNKIHFLLSLFPTLFKIPKVIYKKLEKKKIFLTYFHKYYRRMKLENQLQNINYNLKFPLLVFVEKLNLSTNTEYREKQAINLSYFSRLNYNNSKHIYITEE